jgi:hypothetical protein
MGAVAACILVIPGLFLGGLIAWIYERILWGITGGTIFSTLGFEIVDEIIFLWLAGFIQGAIAGMFCLFVASKIFRNGVPPVSWTVKG